MHTHAPKSTFTPRSEAPVALLVTVKRETNAQKNARTRALFFELHALDKCSGAAAARRRDSIREEIVSLSEQLIRAAHAAFLDKRSGHNFKPADIEDLLQEARVGLCKAINRYDPALKTQFCTYAYAMAFGEMNHAARDRFSIIREPTKHHDERVRRERAERNGEAPHQGAEVIAVFPIAYCVGLPGQSNTIGAIVEFHDDSILDGETPDFATQSTDRVGISQALKMLKARGTTGAQQAAAIISHHFEEKSLAETGLALGVSNGEAESLIAHGLAQLRNILE